MPKPNAKKRRVNRVKGSASRGRGKKWILVLLVVLLLIPAMQVAVVRFINPPWTLPMLIEQCGAMFSSTPKPPLRYRWIGLPQIPEMFLKHLWISEDQRFFQHEGFDWKEMDLAVKEAERKGKPVRGASTITNQCARSIFLWQGRSWIRKGLESYYTIWMEALLPKRRILDAVYFDALFSLDCFKQSSSIPSGFAVLAALRGIFMRQTLAPLRCPVPAFQNAADIRGLGGADGRALRLLERCDRVKLRHAALGEPRKAAPRGLG